MLQKYIGYLLKKARNNAGDTQKDLSEKIGKSRVSVANYEAGKQVMPLDILYKVADALCVEISDLIPEKDMFPEQMRLAMIPETKQCPRCNGLGRVNI